MPPAKNASPKLVNWLPSFISWKPMKMNTKPAMMPPIPSKILALSTNTQIKLLPSLKQIIYLLKTYPRRNDYFVENKLSFLQ